LLEVNTVRHRKRRLKTAKWLCWRTTAKQQGSGFTFGDPLIRVTGNTGQVYKANSGERYQVNDNNTLLELFEAFAKAKKAERIAPRTLEEYRKHILYLNRWLEENGHSTVVGEITRGTMYDFINWMSFDKLQYGDHPYRPKSNEQQGLGPGTVNIRMRSIKSVLNWAEQEGYILKSPVRGIKPQKEDWDHIVAYTTEQIRTILDTPDRLTHTGHRDYTMMLILFDCGLRISELVSIEIDNIDFEARLITIPWEKAKTRKTRTVPISPETADAIRKLIAWNREAGLYGNKLFYSNLRINRKPGIMSDKAFDERLKYYQEKCGIPLRSHRFRHTFALHYIKNGGDPFSLQKILGHSTMEMVKRYVRMCDADVREQHRKYTPLNMFLDRVDKDNNNGSE
jgi:integrase/recombinase XerD